MILLWWFSKYQIVLNEATSIGPDIPIKLFSPGTDGSYFEAFQYMLLMWTSISAYCIEKRFNSKLYVGTIIWAFLFADDMFRLHDGIGSDMVNFISSRIYILLQELGVAIVRLKDIHEATWWGLVLLAIIILIACAIYYPGRNMPASQKELITFNFNFWVCLGFFGIIIDIIHANINIGLLGNGMLTLIEESGEFLAITAAFLYHIDLIDKFKNTSAKASDLTSINQ